MTAVSPSISLGAVPTESETPQPRSVRKAATIDNQLTGLAAQGRDLGLSPIKTMTGSSDRSRLFWG